MLASTPNRTVNILNVTIMPLQTARNRSYVVRVSPFVKRMTKGSKGFAANGWYLSTRFGDQACPKS